MSDLTRFWAVLESIPGFGALPADWLTQLTPEEFNAAKDLCLDPGTIISSTVTCPRRCGCNHYIIYRHDGSGAVGTCHCDPPACPDIPLTIQDITPWALNWTRLGYALANALDCTPKLVDLEPPDTKQIGSWSTQAVPVILTIHGEPTDFLAALGQLAVSQGKPFILLAPTASNLDAVATGLLHHARAEFFGLDSIVALDPNGKLKPLRPPSELFSQLAPASLQHSNTPILHHSGPRYALRKHLGVWHLIFDGQEAYLRHERGLFYVHWLLYHPDECPIHAIDLMAKIPEIYRQQLGLAPLVDPVTGKTATLEAGARLQERSLALDDRESMRALYKKQKELEALLGSDSASEPEKAEALRELEQLYAWQRCNGTRTQDSAKAAAASVRQAIKRLHVTSSLSITTDGTHNRPLKEFAAHIKSHLLIPSAALSAHAGHHVKSGYAGCFTYSPSALTTWL